MVVPLKEVIMVESGHCQNAAQHQDHDSSTSPDFPPYLSVSVNDLLPAHGTLHSGSWHYWHNLPKLQWLHVPETKGFKITIEMIFRKHHSSVKTTPPPAPLPRERLRPANLLRTNERVWGNLLWRCLELHRAMLPELWSLDQQHEHHMGTSYKCQLPGSTQTCRIRNSGVGVSHPYCSKPSSHMVLMHVQVWDSLPLRGREGHCHKGGEEDSVWPYHSLTSVFIPLIIKDYFLYICFSKIF